MKIAINELPSNGHWAREILRDIALSEEMRSLHKLVHTRCKEAGYLISSKVVVTVDTIGSINSGIILENNETTTG